MVDLFKQIARLLPPQKLRIPLLCVRIKIFRNFPCGNENVRDSFSAEGWKSELPLRRRSPNRGKYNEVAENTYGSLRRLTRVSNSIRYCRSDSCKGAQIQQERRKNRGKLDLRLVIGLLSGMLTMLIIIVAGYSWGGLIFWSELIFQAPVCGFLSE